MDADTHIQLHVRRLHDAGDGVDHVEAHFDCAVRVVGAGLRQSRHAVVAVAEYLDA